jgi:hypothetical protein
MSNFQHFQNQAEQKSNKPKFSTEALSLSGLLQYAESAKKQSFEAVCRLQPLVKTYREKIEKTSQAMIQAESSLEGETEIPAAYAAALTRVKESFAVHLGSLEEWMSVLTEKRESHSEKAMAKVKQSGEQLETSLKGLSVPE